ncbi:hypothetical protein HN587_04000 [Candidatus Woesearchaeota archaeon]|nr:hypothetical protein [Candidatus Woesearchaeota archaeon]
MKQQNKICKFQKIILLVLTLLALLILCSSFVFSVGVLPARKYFDYVPGKSIKGELTLMNDGGLFTARVYAKGELAAYVNFDKEIFSVDSDQTSVVIPYTLILPEVVVVSGENLIEIVIEEIPQEKRGMSTKLVMVSQAIVRVPFPDKYAEGKLFVTSGSVNETVTFTSRVFNLGSEDINSAQVKIEIFNPDNLKIDEVISEPVTLSSSGEHRFELTWTADVFQGEYTAVATIAYDEYRFNITEKFNIGLFEIALYDMQVESFNLGEVARFNISLLNLWNVPLRNVYLKFKVYDETDKLIGEHKTFPVDIDPRKIGNVEAFWYTNGVTPDRYRIVLEIIHEDKIFEKEVEVIVGTDFIKPVMERVTGQIIGSSQEQSYETQEGIVQKLRSSDEKKEKSMFFISILVITVLVSVLINIFIIRYFMKKRKNDDYYEGRF